MGIRVSRSKKKRGVEVMEFKNETNVTGDIISGKIVNSVFVLTHIKEMKNMAPQPPLPSTYRLNVYQLKKFISELECVLERIDNQPGDMPERQG